MKYEARTIHQPYRISLDKAGAMPVAEDDEEKNINETSAKIFLPRIVVFYKLSVLAMKTRLKRDERTGRKMLEVRGGSLQTGTTEHLGDSAQGEGR
jgi:hypothetical protein